MTIYSRLIASTGLLMGCIFISLTAQAQFSLTVAEQSPIIQKTQRSALYYTFPISAMRKVNGVIGAEYNLFLSGNLTGTTWQMLPGLSAKTAYDSALKELKAKNAQVIYQCHGRACGSSNQWANQVFSQSRLYGLDTQQSYAALKQDTLNGPHYYALYSTERGNKKVYLHLEMIQGK
jgi:hypothetical protein